MSLDKITTQKISSKVSASIISTNSTTRLDQPLWAINWFDLKRGWLYEWYNRLVISHVKNVAAYPIFKGKLSHTILDNERLRREMLLIVKYPKALAFLDLISSTLFQIKSLFRTKSVAHFQFGFMQKMNTEELKIVDLKYTGKLKYFVHVCENETPIDIDSIIQFAASKEVYPHFVGQKSAIVGFQKERGKLKTLDFMLNYVLVFNGYDHEALKSFVKSKFYQEVIRSNKTNFIGLYDRKI